MLECLKGLVPCEINARVFHRLLECAFLANADIPVPMVATFLLPDEVHFEVNADLFPHARIFTTKHEGYLLKLGNVSRAYMLRDSTLDMSFLKTCECKAAHLFLVKLRIMVPRECTCGSFLQAWSRSIMITKTCPFLHTPAETIHQDALEMYSLFVADARHLLKNV